MCLCAQDKVSKDLQIRLSGITTLLLLLLLGCCWSKPLLHHSNRELETVALSYTKPFFAELLERVVQHLDGN
jgi:hypothetical protein